MSIAEIRVVAPGEGRTVSVLGDRYTLKALGGHTRGAWSLTEVSATPAAPGPPPHIHENEEEAFYVLEGTLRVIIGERTVDAPAGTFALVPRGTVHTFSNPGLGPARLLVIISPAGFEQAFVEMSEVAPRGDQPPDMERLLAIARKYNLNIVGPPGGA